MSTVSTRPAEARVLQILDEYLAELRAGRAPDRAALLTRHPDLADSLAASFRALDFVHDAGRTLAVPEAADAPGGGEPPAAGRVLGDYRLLREIGRGGMAVVYEAEQISLGRNVALKVLPFAAVLDPKRLQRFKNEAQAAAHLHHPHIVPVHAVGCERGVHYYAMQYIEGQSLAVAIRDLKGGGTGEGTRTPISSHGSNREPAYIRMAAALGLQAAEALDHAHQLGIVHRDVKPGNLLVGVAGTLWVTDFGLAHSLKDVGLTITGELLGTIRYMSPEQALAKRVPIDHRTDIYSLGVTLYELLTLEPAFAGDDPHLLLQDIAFKEPVLPRRLNPALPRDLETVLLKAMSKDPGGRYATAQEMADDLRRYLENRAIEAKRPGPLRRVMKWSGRHRAIVGAAAGVLLLAVAGLATSSALLWQEQQRTNAAFERAEGNLVLALAALDEVYIDEAEGHARIRAGLPRDLLEKGLGFYEAFAKENVGNGLAAGLMSHAYHRAGLIFRKLGEEERAVQHFERALSACDRVLAVDPRDAGAHNGRANALGELGRREQALAAYDRAIAIGPQRAVVHTNRSHTLHDLGRLDEALAACDRALAIDPQFAAGHNARGRELRAMRRFEEALEAFDQALAINPQDSIAHNNRGNALRDLGRLEDSLAELDRAIELDSRSALAHSNRGTTLLDLRRFEEALAACDRSIEIDPRYTSAHIGRGNVLRDQGHIEDALAAYDRAIAIDPRDADAYNNRGAVLCNNLGRPGDALEDFDRAIALDPRHVDAHDNRGVALRVLGRFEDALVACDRSLAINPPTARAHKCRGNALRDLGRFEDALAAYRRCIDIDPRNAAAHITRGVVLCDHLGQPGEALVEFDRAIDLDPRLASAHVYRGVALLGLGRFDDVLTACERAIEIDARLAYAHVVRGNALQSLTRVEDALEAYDQAIAIDPLVEHAHNCRGTALRELGELQEAIEAFDKAIEVDGRDVQAHFNRGNALEAKGDPASIASFVEATRLKPDFAEAHCNLGLALARLGRFQEALPSLRRGHELGSNKRRWAYPSKKWVEDTERKAATEARLERVLSGAERPRDALERIGFAEVLYAKSRHEESARMYVQAFAEDAALAEDLAEGHRYDAACSAALAAAKGAADAAAWRGRAIEWLRADLAARQGTATGLVAKLEHWKRDADLASVRDRPGDLPESEREAWQRLWAAVDEALASARQASR